MISRLKLIAAASAVIASTAALTGTAASAAAMPRTAGPQTVGPDTYCTYKVINVVDDYLFVYSSDSTSDHIGDFGPGEEVRGHHGNVIAGGRQWKYVTGTSENYENGKTVTGYVHATASGTSGGTPYLEQISCDES